MICDNLKIFSQNVHKNSLIVNTILETQLSFKNPHGQLFVQFQALLVAKGKNWLELLIIPTGLLLPDPQQMSQISQEYWPILTFKFLISIFLCKMTFSITGVIKRMCGQTLGLELEQIRYSSSYIISLQWEKRGHMTWKSHNMMLYG